MSTPKRVIDDSSEEDEGEIDHLGRNAAVEYLLMPERVKNVEGQMEVIGTDLKSIKGNLRRIADALGKLCDLEGLVRASTALWKEAKATFLVLWVLEESFHAF